MATAVYPETQLGGNLASPLDHFDRIVCINLDERSDRWQQMQASVAPLLGRVKLDRFSAVKPDLARESVFNGRAGCLLSHRKVIEAAYRDGLENVLVFEDDVRFDPQFVIQAQRSIKTLDATQWDMFYLGLTPKAPLIPSGEHLVRTFGGLTTHAIAYHRRAMPRLLGWLPKEKDVLRFLSRYKAIDRYYALHTASRLRCYAASPLLAFQRDDYSDIQQRHTTSNEQQAKQAFNQHLIEGRTPLSQLRLCAILSRNRWRCAVDGTRRRIFRPIQAK